jgi:hypothetical protein
VISGPVELNRVIVHPAHGPTREPHTRDIESIDPGGAV